MTQETKKPDANGLKYIFQLATISSSTRISSKFFVKYAAYRRFKFNIVNNILVNYITRTVNITIKQNHNVRFRLITVQWCKYKIINSTISLLKKLLSDN